MRRAFHFVPRFGVGLLALLASAAPVWSAPAESVPTSYVPYRFEPAEGWSTHGAGNVGATALAGRAWRFDFSQGAEWVALGLPDRTLLSQPTRLRLRVRGAAPGHPVRVRMHTHFMTFEKVVGELIGDAEQELAFDAPPGPGWEWSGGENDGKLHGPLRLGEIRLEANGHRDSGTLELLDLTAEGRCPADRLCVLTASAVERAGRMGFEVTLRSLATRPLKGTLRWTLRTWDGESLVREERPVTLPPEAVPTRVELAAPALPARLRFVEADVSVEIPGQVVSAAQACWLRAGPVQEDAALRPESPFGMGIYLSRFDGEDRERVARKAREAGVKWSREDFTWGSIEVAPGRYEWGFYDRLLECAQRNGITVYAIVAYFPGWSKGYTAEGVDQYVAFLRVLVQRYRDRIRQWEIWNEPNIFFWQGPKALYADLLIKSYRAIKEVDPGAEVLGLSTAGIDLQFIESMLAKSTPFDILTIHPYRKTLDDAAFITDLKRASDLVRRPDGSRRPVWLTEMGWATHAPHHVLEQDFKPVTERAQAELIARTYLCALVSGVEPRTFWYNFRNDGNDPFYFEYNIGIQHQDLRPKPAYQAFATLTRVLAGRRLDGPIEVGSGSYGYRFVSTRDAFSRVLALWNPQADARVTVPVPAGPVRLVNAVGEETLAEPVGGADARRLEVALRKGSPVYVWCGAE